MIRRRGYRVFRHIRIFLPPEKLPVYDNLRTEMEFLKRHSQQSLVSSSMQVRSWPVLVRRSSRLRVSCDVTSSKVIATKLQVQVLI